MGTIKKFKDHTTRYIAVPSFTILEVARHEKGKPDQLRNLGTVFERAAIIGTAQHHAKFAATQTGDNTLARVPSDAIKFESYTALDGLFKNVEVFDSKPTEVALAVDKAIAK